MGISHIRKNANFKDRLLSPVDIWSAVQVSVSTKKRRSIDNIGHNVGGNIASGRTAVYTEGIMTPEDIHGKEPE
jgi:hypothetical protein